MTPIFFGTSQRRLFGVYDPPRGRNLRRAVVLCNPLGSEYYHAHRALRQLARLLSNGGTHTLRFDYPGTGNSSGELAEFSAPDLEDAIVEAIEELEDMANLTRVALVGIRAGAVLAAALAGKRRDVDRLVLWDPVEDPSACGDDFDPLPATLAESLRRTTLTPLLEHLPRSLVMTTQEAHQQEASFEGWQEAGLDGLAFRCCPGPSVWKSEGDFGSGGLPSAALKEMAEWLTAKN